MDLYPYVEAWELDAPDAIAQFYGFELSRPPDRADDDAKLHQGPVMPILKSNTILLDLRRADDFSMWHLPLSINLPLESLRSDSPQPFSDSSTLEKQWLELDLLFQRQGTASDAIGIMSSLQDQRVLVLCYNGDTSRIATSILRARGVEASSLKRGVRGLLY